MRYLLANRRRRDTWVRTAQNDAMTETQMVLRPRYKRPSGEPFPLNPPTALASQVSKASSSSRDRLAHLSSLLDPYPN